ncbi:MAG: hypothetical protein V1750_06145 [Acidobacteriota bacterium]
MSPQCPRRQDRHWPRAIDLGPKGGEAGGRIIAAGTPEEVAAHPASYTGQYLAPLLCIPVAKAS